MMRVGINLLYLIPGIVGGTETYAISLLSYLSKIDKNNEYFIFINKESSESSIPNSPNFHKICCPIRASNRGMRYLWEQNILPIQSKYHSLDILHSLGYVSPIFCPCASVVTIPDLNFIALKNIMSVLKQKVLKYFVSQSAKRASHIITISKFSKSEIQKYFHISPDKITVTHLGPGWIPESQQNDIWYDVKNQYNLPKSYIVAFSSNSPHKNIQKLINAYRRIANEIPQNLVLIGNLPLGVENNSFHKNCSRIKSLGYIPSSYIHPILNHADLFVMPSLYEGFGLPILEAQNAGVAVACSNTASLPEVAGEGAIFFDPNSEKEIGETIIKCLVNPDIKVKIKSRGIENIHKYSWDITAINTLEVYKMVYKNRNIGKMDIGLI